MVTIYIFILFSPHKRWCSCNITSSYCTISLMLAPAHQAARAVQPAAALCEATVYVHPWLASILQNHQGSILWNGGAATFRRMRAVDGAAVTPPGGGGIHGSYLPPLPPTLSAVVISINSRLGERGFLYTVYFHAGHPLQSAGRHRPEQTHIYLLAM